MVIAYYIGGEPHYLLNNGETVTAKQYEAIKVATAKKDEWVHFEGGVGGGMCAVYTGSYRIVRWHTNMLTGEYVGFPN